MQSAELNSGPAGRGSVAGEGVSGRVACMVGPGPPPEYSGASRAVAGASGGSPTVSIADAATLRT